jgi:hypothetical protein
MTHTPARQRAARRHDHRTHGIHLRDAGKGANALGGQVGLCDYTEHPDGFACTGDIDPFYNGMSMGRAQHTGVDLPGHREIGDISTPAGEKPRIFQPAYRAPAIVPYHPPSPLRSSRKSYRTALVCRNFSFLWALQRC